MDEEGRGRPVAESARVPDGVILVEQVLEAQVDAMPPPAIEEDAVTSPVFAWAQTSPGSRTKASNAAAAGFISRGGNCAATTCGMRTGREGT
jgi:hypothetical protein